MMIYDMVELCRLVSYQLSLSTPLSVSVSILLIWPGSFILQYHCINTNQMVRTEEYLSAKSLSLLSHPHIPASDWPWVITWPGYWLLIGWEWSPRNPQSGAANILSLIFHISGFRLRHADTVWRHESTVRQNMIKYCCGRAPACIPRYK